MWWLKMNWNTLEAATMTEQGFILVNGEYIYNGDDE